MKTHYCIVCGEPVLKEKDPVQTVLCSQVCRDYWNMSEEERTEYQKELLTLR